MADIPQLLIRLATKAEAAKAYRAACESLPFIPGPLDSDRLLLCDEIYAAEIGSEIAGIIAMASSGCDGRAGSVLATLYVCREFRGQRIGEQLCNYAIRQFVTARKAPVFCDATTQAMSELVKRLSPDVRQHLEVDFSFDREGDLWEGLDW